MQSPLSILRLLSFSTTLPGRDYYYLHVTDEITQAQRRYMTGAKPQAMQGQWRDLTQLVGLGAPAGPGGSRGQACSGDEERTACLSEISARREQRAAFFLPFLN